jgi:hypothetical protein
MVVSAPGTAPAMKYEGLPPSVVYSRALVPVCSNMISRNFSLYGISLPKLPYSFSTYITIIYKFKNIPKMYTSVSCTIRVFASAIDPLIT